MPSFKVILGCQPHFDCKEVSDNFCAIPVGFE